MAVIDFRAPAAGFDHPIEMWHACHERIKRMSTLLQRLARHIGTHGADADARVTATSILRYFDEAAPRHHDDEEIDLFPLLLERAAGAPATLDAARIGAAIRTLQADHASLTARWQAMREPLLRVQAGERGDLDEPRALAFCTRYRAHIALEETQIGPALEQALDADDLRRVGRAMAARRGVDWDEITQRLAE
jgi:hemerythrin-like domain-containing protein